MGKDEDEEEAEDDDHADDNGEHDAEEHLEDLPGVEEHHGEIGMTGGRENSDEPTTQTTDEGSNPNIEDQILPSLRNGPVQTHPPSSGSTLQNVLDW